MILMMEAEDVVEAMLDVSTTRREADDNRLVAETVIIDGTSMGETAVVGGDAGTVVVAPQEG